MIRTMTFFTKRYNVEPMFSGVAFMVVIFLRRFKVGIVETKFTWQSTRFRQFSLFNSCSYRLIRLILIKVLLYSISLVLFAFFFYPLLTVLESLRLAFFSFVVLQASSFLGYLAFFALSVFPAFSTVDFLALFCLTIPFFVSTTTLFFVPSNLVFLSALLTGATIAVTRTRPFVKFTKRFNLLAFSTLFCYGWFRHSFFLIKKSCLGPVTAHTVLGSFHYNTSRGLVQ